MFRPNVSCIIEPLGDAQYDAYGRIVPVKSVSSRCGVVKLTSGHGKTSVRADSSASRGKADEIVADARLLFLPATSVNVGDRVTVMGVQLRVISVFPRHQVQGRLDHLQVDCEVWA